MTRDRVAVIGSGVSGLTAAYLLQRRYDVLLFEADDRLGGHAHTHDVTTSGGGQLAVDSGFIVHNRRTYPNLLRLFAELDVPTQESEMSMSVRCDGCGLEFAGGKGITGMTAQPSRLARPGYLRMLAELPRFHRAAHRLLDDGGQGGEATLGEFLADGGYSESFVDHLLLPLVSAVWSADLRTSRSYPARYLFAFLANHGMLAVTGSPPWRTVTGGSRVYVDRAVKDLTAVRVSTPVRSVTRHPDGVRVRDDAGETHDTDRVVIATHADQALRLLERPTDAERRALAPWTYSRNEALLHQDPSVLPRAPRARASWNYRKPSCHAVPDRVQVSYDMNRLQRLPVDEPYVVTLNGQVDEQTVLARMTYEHPVYTPESVAAQAGLPALNTERTAFAGAYHGWGFHEDGCAAGVRAAESFGAGWS